MVCSCVSIIFCIIFHFFHDVKVNESFPFSISVSWKGSSSDAQESGSDNKQSALIFPKGNPIPSVKALKIFRPATFSIDVQYDDVSGLQTPAKISTYSVSQFSSFYSHLIHSYGSHLSLNCI